MKKKQLRILAVLACIALLLGIALAALSYEKAPEALPALTQLSESQITAISYTNSSGTQNFVRSSGIWQLEGDPDFPVNGTLLQGMLSVLCSVTPQAVMEDPDLEELGLNAPQCTIDITADTGSQTIVIGSMNALTEQLYVLSGNTVYLTGTALLQAFSGSLLDLAQQAVIPTPQDQQRVEIVNADHTVVLSCVGSQTGGEDGVWYVEQDGVFVMADQDAAYNYYFLTWDMHWLSTAGYIGQSSQLAAYGLDQPQVRYTLTYGGGTFDLLLGADLPDGTTYAMCPGSNLIYTMDSVLAQWLTQATAETVIATQAS